MSHTKLPYAIASFPPKALNALSTLSGSFPIFGLNEWHLSHYRLSHFVPHHHTQLSTTLVHPILHITHCDILAQSRTWPTAGHKPNLLAFIIDNLCAFPCWSPVLDEKTHSTSFNPTAFTFLLQLAKDSFSAIEATLLPAIFGNDPR